MPAHRSNTFRRARAWLFAAVSCCAPLAGAQAAVHCIESVGQVAQEFDAARTSSGTLEEVRIKQGNYFFTSGLFGYFGLLQGTNKVLTISGGWSGVPGQCTKQDGGPETTVFWGLGERRVFAFTASTTFSGTVVVENMTFGGGHATQSTSGSCLALVDQGGATMAVRVDRVRFESCTAAPGVDAPVLSLVAAGGVIFRNSLVAGNDSATAVPVIVSAKGGSGWVLNNTFANNTSANANGFVGIIAGVSNGASITVANNLFDGNVATAAARVDVRLVPGVTLTNNRFTGLSGVPTANTGSSTGPAGFDGPGFELSPSSTALDAGSSFVPLLQGAFDLDGEPRVQGGAVDLGALEYMPLLKDSFE